MTKLNDLEVEVVREALAVYATYLDKKLIEPKLGPSMIHALEVEAKRVLTIRKKLKDFKSVETNEDIDPELKKLANDFGLTKLSDRNPKSPNYKPLFPRKSKQD